MRCVPAAWILLTLLYILRPPLQPNYGQPATHDLIGPDHLFKPSHPKCKGHPASKGESEEGRPVKRRLRVENTPYRLKYSFVFLVIFYSSPPFSYFSPLLICLFRFYCQLSLSLPLSLSLSLPLSYHHSSRLRPTYH